jgi:hypothetical protein
VLDLHINFLFIKEVWEDLIQITNWRLTFADLVLNVLETFSLQDSLESVLDFEWALEDTLVIIIGLY